MGERIPQRRFNKVCSGFGALAQSIFLIIISAPIRLGIVAVSAILLLSYLNFFGSVGLTLFDLGMIKEAGKRDALSTSLFKNTRADEYAGKCPNQRVVKRNPDTASYIDKKQ